MENNLVYAGIMKQPSLLMYIGMWGDWVVMFDRQKHEHIALPLEAGYAPIRAAGLSELGAKIEAARQTKAANREIGGNSNV